MEQYEFNTHTFVAKIWLEETADEAGRAGHDQAGQAHRSPTRIS